MQEQENMVEEPKRKFNIWKLLFFLLLGAILGCIIFIYVKITTPNPSINLTQQGVESVLNPGDPTFLVSVKKDQANALITEYMKPFQDESPFEYTFSLEKQAKLQGKFHVPIIDMEVDFHLFFEPEAMGNGDVMLRPTDLSIGSFPLPVKEILQFVGNNFTLPEFVEIDLEEEAMIVHLSDLRLKDGTFFLAKRIDLVNDEIEIEVFYKGGIS